MDGTRFDDLTRFLAETPSRRTVVKAMVGAIAGSLASIGTALGAPRCKRVDQACQSSADCCPGPTANGNVYCAPISKKTKICKACPAETPTACNGGCVDTTSDDTNCGACGETCGGGSSCVDSACQCPGATEALCNGACVDLTSESNCGGCGITCGGGTTCVDGVCACATAGSSLCDGTCVDKSRDNLNCGSCGTVCFGGSSCINGACRCSQDKHFDSTGTCVCGGTSCSSNANCCIGFVCGDGGQCEPCTTAGTAVNDAAKCCSHAAEDGICVDICNTDSDCVTGSGQTCTFDGLRRLCACGAGEHMVAGGSCVCEDTGCGDRDDCCGGYVCSAASTCEVCKPAGTGLTQQEISPDPCCGSVACDAGEPNGLCTCVNDCTTDGDCQPGSDQVCAAGGFCHCGLGKRLRFDGVCVCDGAGCVEDSHCCSGFTCESGFCRAA